MHMTEYEVGIWVQKLIDTDRLHDFICRRNDINVKELQKGNEGSRMVSYTSTQAMEEAGFTT